MLSFQISGYELLLETQQSFQSATNSVKNKVTHARTVLQELFGSSAPGKAETLTTSDETVQEKVDQFRSKLIRLTRCIGMLV